jgi:hypothetical protein
MELAIGDFEFSLATNDIRALKAQQGLLRSKLEAVSTRTAAMTHLPLHINTIYECVRKHPPLQIMIKYPDVLVICAILYIQYSLIEALQVRMMISVLDYNNLNTV